MSLVINHNMMSIYAAGSLNKSYNSLTQATKRLSSGLRINSAADDPAGMNIVFSLSCVKYFKGTSFRDRRIRENRMSGGDSELGIGDSLFRSIAHRRLWENHAD